MAFGNTFNNCMSLGKVGVKEVENFMYNYLYNIEYIINVEDNLGYQKEGIDLICITNDIRGRLSNTVEVKTTRYKDEYYFIETISNTTKNTLGSFLTCQAEDILFYFINYKKLHKIRTRNFILWFLKYQNEFETKEVETRDNFGNVLYTTVGKLVPCARVIEELNVQVFDVKLYEIESNKTYIG